MSAVSVKFRKGGFFLIGVDIVDIDRIEMSVKRTPRFLQRVFTPQEIEYCFKKSNPYPSLAVRFAAKEAVRKVDPIFSSGIRFHDIEVVPRDKGRPGIILSGQAIFKAEERGIKELHISLSHAQKQGIAVVIAEKG